MRTLAPFGAVFDVGFLSATYKIANAVYTKQKPPYPEVSYVPKGVFAKRRYPGSWLTSKLDAHFAGMRTLAPFGAVFDVGFLSATYKIANAVYTKQKPPYWEVSYVAERKGFEPLIPVRVYTISSRAP